MTIQNMYSLLVRKDSDHKFTHSENAIKCHKIEKHPTYAQVVSLFTEREREREIKIDSKDKFAYLYLFPLSQQQQKNEITMMPFGHVYLRTCKSIQSFCIFCTLEFSLLVFSLILIFSHCTI